MRKPDFGDIAWCEAVLDGVRFGFSLVALVLTLFEVELAIAWSLS